MASTGTRVILDDYAGTPGEIVEPDGAAEYLD